MACLAAWTQTGDPVWAALARAGAWLNILNLIPVWVLDGGSAANALSREQRLLLVITALVLAVVLGEGLFYLVAAGAAYRLFSNDFPPQPSWMILGYFVTLMGLLGFVFWMTPHTARGI
jgi:Zn-dependent protease